MPRNFSLGITLVIHASFKALRGIIQILFMRYSTFPLIASSLVALLFVPVEPAYAQMLTGYGDENHTWEPDAPVNQPLEAIENTGVGVLVAHPVPVTEPIADTEQPVDLVADTLQHDDKAQMI